MKVKLLIFLLPFLLITPVVYAEDITVTDATSRDITEDSAVISVYLENHPAPESELNVTGDLDPDVTGIYEYGGMYLDRPYWLHETDEWKIHISPDQELRWLLTDDFDKKPHQSQFSKLAFDDPISLWEEERGEGIPQVEYADGEIVYGYFRYRKEGSEEWTYTEDQYLLADGIYQELITELESGTNYEFQGIVEYEGGIYESDVETFETEYEETEEHEERRMMIYVVLGISVIFMVMGIVVEQAKVLLPTSGLLWMFTAYLMNTLLIETYPYIFILFSSIGGFVLIWSALRITGETA